MRGAAPRRTEPAGRLADAASGGLLLRALGMQIRELRKARNMTLADLASRAGMSVSYVSQVERSLSSPSVVALYEISRALGVNISFFFADGDAGPDGEQDFVVRAGHRRKVAFEAGAVDELLSPNLNGRLELLMSHLPPGSMSGVRPYTHDGEEGGIVVSGRLEVTVDDERRILDPGDAYYFESRRPHRFRCVGGKPCEVISACTPPTF